VNNAIKHDAGKPRVDLLPFAALEEIGHAFGYGAGKYADHNYRKGFVWSRLLGSCLRHVFAWGRGEEADPESGLSHLAHAGACVLMMLDAEIYHIGTDDRWRPSEPPPAPSVQDKRHR
jgi:hypothetical protein